MSVSIRTLAFSAAVAVWVGAAGFPALAEGTSEQRQACMSDAMSLCASAIPDAGRIAACLRREQARVSPACLHVMNVATRSVSLKE